MPLPPGRGTCSIEGCDRDIFTNRGWCEMHYQRWVRRGDAGWEPPAKVSVAVCSIGGCSEPVRAKGLCSDDYHRSQYRKRRQREGRPPPTDVVRSCDLCGTQYRRVGRGGLRYCSSECGRTARALYYLLRDYGLTREAYYDLLDRQKHVCAICAEPDMTKGILSVDHDHATGKVRGLLCHTCNVGLGHFRDNSSLLARAADYVRTA